MNNNNSLLRHLAWLVVAIVGAAALGVVALRRGEAINALWIVVAAVAIYLVAYRYYSLFIASKVMQLDPNRATPAVLNNDGLDYVPTNKHILFGHHFAAIAGAGPLVGPVLAAQMGYLPGTLWLIAGVVLAGAVQDFMVLFISSRRNGRSLGELVREEMGQVAGTIALFGAFLIMIIILAVLALIVVKALADSPWGMFTVLATIPIALFMGVYMRFIRPGRIGEISIIGVFLLLGSIWLGGQVAASPEWAPHFTFSGIQITWMLIGYGAVASVLPVWLLLAPRDYLSTFLKIGTIIGLAIGILIVMPELKMPALTQFTDGTGPVWKGSLFPFLFITIACGGSAPTSTRWPRPSAAGASPSRRSNSPRPPRTSARPPSWPVPAARRPWRWGSRTSSTRCCRARTPWPSGTTSRSSSRPCSSSPRWTPAPVPGASCCRTCWATSCRR